MALRAFVTVLPGGASRSHRTGRANVAHGTFLARSAGRADRTGVAHGTFLAWSARRSHRTGRANMAHRAVLARRASGAGQTLRTSEALRTGVPVLTREPCRTDRSRGSDMTLRT
jgi:hypothetical protein